MADEILTSEEQRNAVKTWRYLRVAMIVLVVGLGVSILHEYGNAGWDCLQHSISAYYYTPVRGMFVGGLLAIGACLVCLKGSTGAEDVCLNLAGALAPVVAFVPVSTHSTCGAVGVEGVSQHVDNNVFALVVLGGLGVLTAAVLVRLDPTVPSGPRKPAGWGLWTAFGLWLLATVTFYGGGETFFRENAHYIAAVTMFLFIFAVVVMNALGVGGSPLRNRYGVIPWLMVASGIVAIVGAFAGWHHKVFFIEAAWIALFAWFWILQSKELWRQGLR